MLPSTGYFQSVRCYFYDGGSCDRPYCHFKHSKKGRSQNEELDAVLVAVKLVQEKVGGIEDAENLAARVAADLNKEPRPKPSGSTSSTATYSPTPLAQLRQMQTTVDSLKPATRHIPIPYAPTRPPTKYKEPAYKSIRPNLRITNELNEEHTKKEIGRAEKYIPTSLSSTVTSLWEAPTQTTVKSANETLVSRSEYSPGYVPTYAPNSDVNHEYVPTLFLSRSPSPSSLNKERNKTQQYIPMAVTAPSGTALSSINPSITIEPPDYSSASQYDPEIKYHPTDISSIKTNNSVEYSPTPTQSTDETISYKPTIQKPAVEETVDPLDNLSPEFDFISEILDDVNSDEKAHLISKQPSSNKDLNRKRSSDKSKSSHHHHHSSSKHDKSSSSKKNTSSDSAGKKEKSSSLTSSSARKDHHKHKPTTHESSSSSAKKDSSHLSNKTNGRSSSSKHSSSKHTSSKNNHVSQKHTSSVKSKESSQTESTSKDKKSKEKSCSSSSHRSHNKSNSTSSSSSKNHSTKSSSKNGELSHKSHSNHSRYSKKELNKRQFVTPMLEMSSSSEDDIEEQCRRIFEGEDPNPKDPPKGQSQVVDVPEEIPESESNKKRIAHHKVSPTTRMPKTAKPNYSATSSQMLMERYKIAEQHVRKSEFEEENRKKTMSYQEYKQLKRPAPAPQPSTSKIRHSETEVPKPMLNDSTSLVSMVPVKPAGRVRIAHVPNVSGFLAAEKNLKKPITKSHTVTKGQTRVAHVPAQKQLETADRPVVRDHTNSKIPYHIRTTFLNSMIDVCLDMYRSADAAYERGRNEEYKVFDKCKSLPIYKNSAALCVHRLKNEAKEGIKDEPGTSSMSILTRRLSTPNLYESLFGYILDFDQLSTYGYPRPNPESSEKGAAIVTAHPNAHPKLSDPYQKVCARCHKVFRINKHGFALVPDECVYHPNRHYRVRGELRYACCGSGSESDGCCTASSHVFDDCDYDNLRGFVETMGRDDWDPTFDPKIDYGVYALDCEMSYTTVGMELTRVTVIDRTCKTIYETLVKPFHPVIDYNTRFSGITADKMVGVTTNLLDVQANLLHLFSSRTILIGHSLDSDLRALKLIHDVVIDTSIVFPHRLGLPYRRALRNLASEYLHKIIQNDLSGHDSAEDAITCMELMLYKLQQDMKI